MYAEGEGYDWVSTACCPSHTPVPQTRVKWHPPKSPFQLVQETTFYDPWRLLISTIFLQKTNYKTAQWYIFKFFELYPTPDCARRAIKSQLAEFLKPLGLQNSKAATIIKFSDEYLVQDWEKASDLPGIGKYGSDSYEIFCQGKWREIEPDDYKLRCYVDWMRTSYAPKFLKT